MNNKLKELMELSKATDLLCAEVDKENEIRKQKITEDIYEKWNNMWDQIENEILPAVVTIGFNKRGYFGYEYPYYTQWVTDSHEIKFYYNHYKADGFTPIGYVYMDFGQYHRKINRYDFENIWNRLQREGSAKDSIEEQRGRIEALVNAWDDGLADKIMDDLTERLKASIKEKIKNKEAETKELMRKVGEIDE